QTTALGALLAHLRTPTKDFQPSNVHFGLMPEPSPKPARRNRKKCLAERARRDFSGWLESTKAAG
ncbi:MAG: methylenetetrahydrofolate--tRNA-(uracil(54)-C(5))-methyltransferase (FADH(2)-oxidizing) TrmFO, partial [Mailhella sp.]|nr:methylenetetrahydrofolate--tRNA-(uracil(54)-C(5))-methyltransferase (FADH(2)-oxidizing) TrmFO [Mailhella sp.]